MKLATLTALSLVAVLVAPAATSAQIHGPARGALVIGGGRGEIPTPAIVDRFIELAGGADALILVVPTSGNRAEYDESCPCLEPFRKAGARNLMILHTNDRDVANSEAFVEPLRRARGVWFEEGNAWRHQDAYLDTRVHRELFALLDRGGVVGGGSAGARIQSDYMLRGRSGEPAERPIPEKDWTRGFQLVRNVIIDVHVLARNRHFDLIGAVNALPQMLGVGIDENTAIVVQGDRFEVIGTSYVIIYDNQRQILPEAPETLRTVGGLFFFLAPGDSYDMRTRQPTRQIERVVETKWPTP
jgi:cyanophycinase